MPNKNNFVRLQGEYIILHNLTLLSFIVMERLNNLILIKIANLLKIIWYSQNKCSNQVIINILFNSNLNNFIKINHWYIKWIQIKCNQIFANNLICLKKKRNILYQFNENLNCLS